MKSMRLLFRSLLFELVGLKRLRIAIGSVFSRSIAGDASEGENCWRSCWSFARESSRLKACFSSLVMVLLVDEALLAPVSSALIWKNDLRGGLDVG